MKTIYEWIQELPEPHRSRAMKYEDEGWHDRDYLEKDMESALLWAFYWEMVVEGYDYWELVSEGKYDEALKLVP